MSLNKSLKQTIDQLDLDRRLAELKGSAGELARQHGGKVEEALDKVETRVDATTKGKYAAKLAAARRKVTESVAKVAAQPPVETDEPTEEQRARYRTSKVEHPTDEHADGRAPDGRAPLGLRTFPCARKHRAAQETPRAVREEGLRGPFPPSRTAHRHGVRRHTGGRCVGRVPALRKPPHAPPKVARGAQG